ncbi:hypothetical protein HMPREF1228_1930 [Streptococcus pyogenes GA41345]|nr:hypothetical protein spyM18_1158 [Streptococcus pyogenes MGAS8232]EPZ43076.1 hypothetical protein HMPREF1228_1930 [Streptococcus pyogenes GA41345]
MYQKPLFACPIVTFSFKFLITGYKRGTATKVTKDVPKLPPIFPRATQKDTESGS